MKIDKINDTTIKITLNNSDMEKYNITYDKMDYSNPDTKKAISEIIKVIKTEVSINPKENKLYVEAFPKDNGGCFMFFNIMEIGSTPPPKRTVYSFETPLVFEFLKLDLLTDCCVELQKNYNHMIIKSSLYLFEKKYRLLIYTYCKMDEKLINFLNEYSTYISKGSIISAVTMEHGKPVIEQNAMEMVCKCLQ